MTKIQWTNATWNPVRGCSRVSEGCRHCYAERQAARFAGPGQPFEGITVRGKHGPRWTGEVRLVPGKLHEPLKWRKPRRVFVNSMSDLFHENVPDEFIAAVFGVMAACPQHTFQLLTKRPERAREWFSWAASPDRRVHHGGGYGARLQCCWQALRHEAIHHPSGDNGPLHTKRCAEPDGPWPLPNVHLGVSVEDQATADERIPVLLECPAAVRWVSAEPLLGPVDFSHVPLCPDDPGLLRGSFNPLVGGGRETATPWRINWVVVGGESGAGARPCDVAWIRSIVRDCREARVPVFVKQLGANYVDAPNGVGGVQAAPDPGLVPSIRRLTHPKGGAMEEWPEDLCVREWPREVVR